MATLILPTVPLLQLMVVLHVQPATTGVSGDDR